MCIDERRLGQHHMACMDNLQFMAGIDDASVQLVVTSPPYGIGKEYERKTTIADWVDAQAAVVTECSRLLAEGGAICWQVGNHVRDGAITPLDIPVHGIFARMGFVLRNRIIWHYEHGLHCKRRLSGRYETIMWWTRPGAYKFNLDAIRVPSKYPNKRYSKGPRAGQRSGNPLGKNPGDVWIFPNVKNNHPEKTSHPCQFPVELAERLVLALTDEGDTVLDPYMGVGSAIVASVMHGRAGYGCDADPSYFAIAEERLSALEQGALRVRPMSRRTITPASSRIAPARSERMEMPLSRG